MPGEEIIDKNTENNNAKTVGNYVTAYFNKKMTPEGSDDLSLLRRDYFNSGTLNFTKITYDNNLNPEKKALKVNTTVTTPAENRNSQTLDVFADFSEKNQTLLKKYYHQDYLSGINSCFAPILSHETLPMYLTQGTVNWIEDQDDNLFCELELAIFGLISVQAIQSEEDSKLEKIDWSSSPPKIRLKFECKEEKNQLFFTLKEERISECLLSLYNEAISSLDENLKNHGNVPSAYECMNLQKYIEAVKEIDSSVNQKDNENIKSLEDHLTEIIINNKTSEAEKMPSREFSSLMRPRTKKPEVNLLPDPDNSACIDDKIIKGQPITSTGGYPDPDLDKAQSATRQCRTLRNTAIGVGCVVGGTLGVGILAFVGYAVGGILVTAGIVTAPVSVPATLIVVGLSALAVAVGLGVGYAAGKIAKSQSSDSSSSRSGCRLFSCLGKKASANVPPQIHASNITPLLTTN